MKYSHFAIVASFFGLLIDSIAPHQIQFWMAFFLIFTFGIFHGANDLALIENISFEKGTINYAKVRPFYMISVLIGAGLFYAVPVLALTLFILVSGYHFGEQHWTNQIRASTWLQFPFQLFYGLMILFLLFYFHAPEVQKDVLEITSIQIEPKLFLFGLLFVAGMTLLFGITLYFNCPEFKALIVKELFFLIVFAIIFKASSLIWGFALYFILWHSIPSMLDQVRFLYGRSSIHNYKLYFLKAFPYWVVSLVSFALLYFLFKDQKVFDALFFSFLASITFPHVLVIVKMFEKR